MSDERVSIVTRVPTRTWEGNIPLQAVVKRMLWEQILRDLPDEWIGYGRIVVESDGGGVTCVSASLTPLAPFLDSDIAAV